MLKTGSSGRRSPVLPQYGNLRVRCQRTGQEKERLSKFVQPISRRLPKLVPSGRVDSGSGRVSSRAARKIVHGAARSLNTLLGGLSVLFIALKLTNFVTNILSQIVLGCQWGWGGGGHRDYGLAKSVADCLNKIYFSPVFSFFNC